MDIHAHVVRLVELARSPSEALGAAVRAITEDLHADSCGIFLRAQGGRGGPLALWSRFGGALDERAPDVAEAAANDAVARVLPATREERGLLAVPLLSCGLVSGALVLERNGAAPYSADEVRRVSELASQMLGVIESAIVAESLEGRRAEVGVREIALEVSSGEQVLRGSAAAPGIGIGVATFRQLFPAELVRRDATHRGREAERERLLAALQKTRNDLLRVQSTTASDIGEEHALIFGSHLLFLSDPMLQERVEEGLSAGLSAVRAVDTAIDEMVRRLRDLGTAYVRDRIEDLEDLRSRLLDHLVGGAPSGRLGSQIVISPRTTPSLIVEIKAGGGHGIASELGGTTSHGPILARALGVPAVTGVDDIMQHVESGDPVVVDGDRGLVIVRPTASTLDDYTKAIEAAERQRTELLRYRELVAMTADGVRFTLQANVALGVDLAIAKENGAEGVGLYRTEFPFIVREGLPTVDEQVRIYSKAYDAFPNGPISFRLLDVAGDKFVPTRELGVTRSAFHGYRSLRVLFDYPHILRDQVQAFALAAGTRPLRILVPMVTSLEDMRLVRQLVASSLAQHPVTAALPSPSLGAMIEVPAAVEIVDDLAAEVDFFSIGTNDLLQYALVVDREDPRLSSPRDAYHPAILRMIRRVVRAGHAAGKEVGVCGEIAARPELAIALMALGVDALSVTPRAIPELKQKFAGIPLKPLSASIDRLLRASVAEDIERELRQYVLGQVSSGA